MITLLARRDLAAARLRLPSFAAEAGKRISRGAGYMYRCNLDYDNARAELALAQRTLPNNAQSSYCWVLSTVARPLDRGGAKLRKKALELDPHRLI